MFTFVGIDTSYVRNECANKFKKAERIYKRLSFFKKGVDMYSWYFKWN